MRRIRPCDRFVRLHERALAGKAAGENFEFTRCLTVVDRLEGYIVTGLWQGRRIHEPWKAMNAPFLYFAGSCAPL